MNDYESYGDDLYYNPIHYCPENDMTPEEFEEYQEILQRRGKNAGKLYHNQREEGSQVRRKLISVDEK